MSYISQVQIGNDTYDIRDEKVKQNAAIVTDGEYPVLLGYDTSTVTVINSVNKTSTLKYNPSTGILDSSKYYGTYLNNTIAHATVDSTSTDTAFTATVPEITELRDGVALYLYNNVVTSAANCTLDINGWGAKPLYTSNATATRVASHWAKNTTYLFIYNATRVSGGCWDLFIDYYTYSNTVGYQLRYGTSTLLADGNIYRYMLMLQTSEDQVTPVASVSNNTTTTKTLTTAKFLPFGIIGYYNTTTTIASGDAIPATNFWYAFNNLDLRYSFNSGTTLTAQKDVYIRCVPQSDGYFKLDGNDCIVQDLPTTKDGKVYLMLGRATSTSKIDLYPVHPSYYYDEGLHLWTGECYVRQNGVISDNADYPVLVASSTSTATVTDSVNKTAMTYNPSTGTLSATNATFSGSVTATTYYGDGSNLTGISTDDKYVEQEAVISTNADYPVLLGYDTSTVTVTNVVNKSSDLTYNPSTGVLSAPQISFDSYSATVTDGSTLPYVFRKTEDGNLTANETGSDLKKITGASFAWNQLVPNGDFSNGTTGWVSLVPSYSPIRVEGGHLILGHTSGSNRTWGVYTDDVIKITAGHRYYFSGYIKRTWNTGDADAKTVAINANDANDTNPERLLTFTSISAGTIIHFEKIITPTYNNTRLVFSYGGLIATDPDGNNNIMELWDIQLIDITQDFGTTIAEYVNTTEIGTAGAGVDWIKQYFPGRYYPTAASYGFESVNVAKYLATGFNQWDEQWELGKLYTSSGNPYDSSSGIRTKNFICILPSTEYYICRVSGSGSAWVLFYDNSKRVIEGYSAGSSTTDNASLITNRTFTTPPNGAYMKFYMTNDYGTVYNNNICVNISSSRNGQYEPYRAYETSFDTTVELLGIPALNANNELTYNGDTYEPSGKVTRKFVKEVYDGSEDENWVVRSTTYKYFAIKVGSLNSVVGSYSHILCDKYANVEISGSTSNVGITMINSSTYDGAFVSVRPSDYATATVTTFKQSLADNPITVIYEVVSPTIEYASPYNEYSNVSYEGTQWFIDNGVLTGTRDVEIPVAPTMSYSTYINYALNGSAMSGSSGGGSADNSYYTVDITELTQAFQNSIITIYTGTPSANLTSVYNALINDKKRCKATVTLSEFSNNTVDVMLDGAVANVGVSGTMTYTDSTDLSTYPTAKEVSVQINSTGAIVYVRTIGLYRIPYDGSYVMGDYNGGLIVS